MDIINSITPHQWFLIGGLVASIPGTWAIVEFIKAHHYKKKAEDLWSGFVVLNVLVWSNVLVFADAILNNLGQITHIGSLIPTIAPFVSHYGPIVSSTLLAVHITATALSKWWKDREAHKPITNPNLPDLAAQVQAVTSQSTVSGQKSSSMGSTAAGQTIQL